MRIAFLSSSTGWGGLERNLIRYAQWMAECGHEVEINCVQGSPLAESASATTLNIRHIPRQHRYFAFAEARRLRRHLKHTQTDIVWIRDPRDLPLCSLAIRNSGADLVFHQGMQISKPKTRPWHRVRYKHVSRWIAPLHHLRDEALANTPLRPEQIEVIPLALEANWFSTPKSPKARAMWSLPPDAKIVGLFRLCSWHILRRRCKVTKIAKVIGLSLLLGLCSRSLSWKVSEILKSIIFFRLCLRLKILCLSWEVSKVTEPVAFIVFLLF